MEKNRKLSFLGWALHGGLYDRDMPGSSYGMWASPLLILGVIKGLYDLRHISDSAQASRLSDLIMLCLVFGLLLLFLGYRSYCKDWDACHGRKASQLVSLYKIGPLVVTGRQCWIVSGVLAAIFLVLLECLDCPLGAAVFVSLIVGFGCTWIGVILLAEVTSLFWPCSSMEADTDPVVPTDEDPASTVETNQAYEEGSSLQAVQQEPDEAQSPPMKFLKRLDCREGDSTSSTTELKISGISLYADESRNTETLSIAASMLAERFEDAFQAVGVEPCFVQSYSSVSMTVPTGIADEVQAMAEKVLGLLDMLVEEGHEVALEGQELCAFLRTLTTLDEPPATLRRLVQRALGHDPSSKQTEELKSRLDCVPRGPDAPEWRVVDQVFRREAAGASKFILIVRIVMLGIAGILVYSLTSEQLSSSAVWKLAVLGVAFLIGVVGGTRPFAAQKIYRAVADAGSRPPFFRILDLTSGLLFYFLLLVGAVGGVMFVQGHTNGRYLPGRYHELGLLVFYDRAGWISVPEGRETYEEGMVRSGYSKGPGPGQYANVRARIEYGMDPRPYIQCEALVESEQGRAFVVLLKGVPTAKPTQGKPIVIAKDATFQDILKAATSQLSEPAKVVINDVDFVAVALPQEKPSVSIMLVHDHVGLNCVDKGNASPVELQEMADLLKSVRRNSD